MSSPVCAAVRPRFASPDSGENLLLEDAVRERLERRELGIVWLAGGAGSGVSTALNHLWAIFSTDVDFLIAELPDAHPVTWKRFRKATAGKLAVCAAPDWPSAPFVPLEKETLWTLAPWSRDELIEYLLAAHPQRCAAVMSRLSAGDLGDFDGSPELWQPVLDQLAQRDDLSDAQAALRAVLQVGRSESESSALGERCLLALNGPSPPLFYGKNYDPVPEFCVRLLRHRVARLLLAADFLAECIASAERPIPSISIRDSTDLIATAAERLQGNETARRKLQHTMKIQAQQPLAASLLHAMNPRWRPRRGKRLNLSGAQLGGAEWSGLMLKGARADQADLSYAVLAGVNWKDGRAQEADLSHAFLERANLIRWQAVAANLAHTNLNGVIARGANFDMARLLEASFHSADLRKATFTNAVLHGTSFRRANLRGSHFFGDELTDCDFQRADLSQATLQAMDLRGGRWSGARLRQANLTGCNLEGLDLVGVDLTEACLENALLTDSTLTNCRLDRAFLYSAGLAGVNWEGVSLRGAEMAGASFHLGSSRSGLVGSPLACEGSRTGFYTDDYLEQDYRPPEEIRKANLCGADLIGANIEGVDFYLVDLRGARYDSFQRAYFRSCGAILEDRCRP